MKKMFLGILLSLSLSMFGQTAKDQNLKIGKNIELFGDVCRYLQALYVDSIDADTMGTEGINAMLSTLDPYTMYVPAQEQSRFDALYKGKYAGVGAMIQRNFKEDAMMIWEPYEQMPAHLAGLKRGDVILAIDDESMIGKSSEYVSNHLRGDAGTPLTVKIKRMSTGKVMKVKLVRKTIQMPAISYTGVRNGIGYIGLTQFTEGCAREIRTRMQRMRREGVKAWVLDLRGNGGGLENEAVELVNIFIPQGKLVVTNKARYQRMTEEFKTKSAPLDTITPLVVLVNDNTASASEITSGALQDYDRAVIMGEPTFGKGLVQTTVPLGYNAMLKLTTAKYYIPSGRCIQRVRYKHASGGYRTMVPDSLTQVFYTKNGRAVRDGNGIRPDVKVEADTIADVTYALFRGADSTNVVAQFETDYVAKHPTIAPARSFLISDEDYARFKELVLSSGFKYDMATGRYLKQLKELAAAEGYLDRAKDEFEALEKKLSHDLAHDLDHHKDEIKRMLSSDIATCYYFQSGSTENMLYTDKVYEAAEKLLGDTEAYTRLLQPQPKDDKESDGK